MKKWRVFCEVIGIRKTEWVYADSAEEAMEIIEDNFHDLNPLWAETLPEPETKYYMGHEYVV